MAAIHFFSTTGVLISYAKDTNDQLLMNEASFTESTLNKLNEKEALLKCGSILQRGNEYLAKTAGYDITAEELKALATDLSELETLQPSIGIVTNERKSAVRSVKMLIKEGTFILDKLDDGFEGFLDDDTFLDGWFAVRKIKGRHIYQKPKVPVTVN
jgi:hypothetical protein